MNIFEILIQQPILNVLVAIYQGLILLHVPYALGFAIIGLTIFIRFLLYPLTASQMKMQKKMQEMAPHLSKLKEKHKGDAKGQQAATMALYKEHGVNPAAGCLPALVQLPIFFGLYGVLQKTVAVKSVNEINKLLYTDALKIQNLWDINFFGLPLGKKPSELIASVGIAIILVPIVTGLLQFIQSKMMAVPTTGSKPVVKNDKPDFASTFQSQTLYLLPVMIGFFSWGFPIGLSLYWNTFTLFGIIQQYRVSGWGSMTSLLARLKTNNQ